MEIKWDDQAKENFNKIIVNLPQFHRSIAERLVKEKAEELAVDRSSEIVENKDVVVAFFQEVPAAFKDMMKRLMVKNNIDYLKYIDG